VAVFNSDGLSVGTGGIVTTGQNRFHASVHGLAGRPGRQDSELQRTHHRKRRARQQLSVGVRGRFDRVRAYAHPDVRETGHLQGDRGLVQRCRICRSCGRSRTVSRRRTYSGPGR